MRVERFQIDAEAYYEAKAKEVAEGNNTWVQNFEVDNYESWDGFFRKGQLVALIRERKHHTHRSYPMIFVMKDGDPVPSSTASTFDEAVQVVENL